jgi:hypothetical protein
MSVTTSQSAGTSPRARVCTPQVRVTGSLLGYGILAGPFYVAVSLAQAAVRDGFDLSRHEWSLLANGAGGWVQCANLAVTGLMVLAAALGYARALRSGPGSRWAPRLLAVYGAGLVAAGTFRADPMDGFPVGTPDGPPVDPTVHGALHLAAAGTGFIALVAACVLLCRRFAGQGQTGYARFTATTAAALLVAFVGLAAGGGSVATNLAFTAAVVLTWAWLSAISLLQYRRLS